MAKRVMDQISDMLAGLKQMNQELASLTQMQSTIREMTGHISQASGGTSNFPPQGSPFHVIQGGTNNIPPPPPSAPNPTMDAQNNIPPPPPVGGVMQPQPFGQMFAPLTSQQRFASEFGLPQQGWMVHSDLSQARIAELSLGSSRRQEQIASNIERLRGEGASGIDIRTSQRLEEVNAQWKELSSKVRQLSDSIVGLDETSDEYKKAIKELADATRKSAESRERLTQLEEESAEILRQGGGGSGGGGFGGRLRSFARENWAAGLQAVGQGLQTAGSMYGAYGGVYQAGMQADLASELRIAQSAGATSAIQAQRLFGSMDLTSGENAVRYFGDYLGSDNYSFLGQSGYQRARDLSRELAEREYRFSETGLGFRTTSSMLGMGGTAASIIPQMIAGGAAGGVAGSMLAGVGAVPGTIIGGAYGLFSGLSGLAQQGSAYGQYYAGNQYAMSQGGLAGTGIGSFLYGDESSMMSARSMGQYWTGRQLTEEQYVEALRDSEMKTRQAQMDVQGYNEMQRAIQIRQNFAPMVGQFATSGLPSLSAEQRRQKAAIQNQVGDLNAWGEQEKSALAYQGYNEFYNQFGSPTGDIPNFSVEGVANRLVSQRMMSPIDRLFRDTDSNALLSNAVGEIQRRYKDPAQQLGALNDLQNRVQNQETIFGIDIASDDLKTKFSEALKPLTENLLKAVYSVGSNIQQKTNQAALIEQEIETPLTRQADWLGSMELSFSDWAQKQNTATSMIWGGRASGRLTSELIRMGRAGLGSDSQVAQNVMQLQAVAGRQDDLSQLKEIMAEAVSSGFNKSQMAQRFVAATTQLASSLRTTATGEIARELAFGTQVFGTEGRSSMLSLEEAQRNLGQLGAYTGQTGGITGMMKSFSAFESGMGLGSGAGLALGMNIFQLQEAETAARTGKISDPRTENLIRAQARSRFGVNDLSMLTPQQREEIAAGIQNVSESSMAPIRATINQQMGNSEGFQQLVEEGRRAAQSNDIETYRSIAAEVASYGAQTQAGEGATVSYFMQQTGSGAFREADVQGILQQHIQRGNRNFANPANQARQSFVNRLTAQMSGNLTSQASNGMVERYFEQGGGALSVRGFEDNQLQLQDITSFEEFQNLPANQRSQITNADLMRGIQSKIALTEEGREQGLDYISSKAKNDLIEVIRMATTRTEESPFRNLKGVFGG